MEIKFVLMCVSVVIGTLSYIVYIKQHFGGGNMPHPFSWFVWSITSSTIALAMVYGGAGLGSVPFVVSALLVIAIFLISIPRGVSGISRTDIGFLSVALVGIAVWFVTGDPLLAVFLITGIDFSGYFPTYRKLLALPRSESLPAWFGFFIANVCAIFAQENSSLTTLTYPVVITFATVLLIVLALIGRGREPDRAA